MSLDDLQSHPFVRMVLDDAMAVQRKAGIKPLADASDDPPLDEQQFYITRVGFSLSHLLTWVEQLHHAVHFLAQFNYERRTKEAGVNRFHHLITSSTTSKTIWSACNRFTTASFNSRTMSSTSAWLRNW